MTPQKKQTETPQASLATRYNPVEIITLGWKVLASEMEWIGFKSLRQLEIRQLSKRLNQEYETLGQLSTARNSEPSADMELCKKQIDFLKEEIAYLEKELAAARQEFVKRRIRKLHLDTSPNG